MTRTNPAPSPERKSSSFRLRPGVAFPLLVFWLGFFTWFISFHPATRYIPFAILGQVYAYTFLFLAFRYWPPMARLVAGMPLPHRIVFGVLIGAVVAGHFTLETKKYYPYVAWEIFPRVREDNPVTCRELIATTADGKKARLLVEQLFPSIVQFDLPQDPVALAHLVKALAAEYDRQHAGDPVRSVDLVLLAVPLHPPASEWRPHPSCALLQSYDLSSAP